MATIGRALQQVKSQLDQFVCDSDVERWVSMSGRFSTPVYPGDTLTVEAWVDGPTARFRTSSPAGVVIDRGVLCFKP